MDDGEAKARADFREAMGKLAKVNPATKTLREQELEAELALVKEAAYQIDLAHTRIRAALERADERLEKIQTAIEDYFLKRPPENEG